MKKPCMANMVPGGKTPILPPATIARGRLQARALSGDAAVVGDRRDAGDARSASAGLKTPQPPAISFTDLQGVVGFPDYWSRETRYQAKE